MTVLASDVVQGDAFPVLAGEQFAHHLGRAAVQGQEADAELLQLGQHGVGGVDDAVEEVQGGDGDADRAGCDLLLGGQEKLVVADLLGAEQVRGLAEVAREQRDLADVACLRVRGQIP